MVESLPVLFHEKGGILGSEIGRISALLLLASMKV